jgi:histidine triad (HIT) family protein
MDCIFCRIARGEVPALVVHQDAHSVAFLDIRPLAPGHTLIIPRRHAVLLEDLPEPEATALFSVVRNVARAAREATGATATTVAVNNGRASGQEVPHAHVHVVPRRDGDGGGPIHAVMTRRPEVSREEMDRIAQAIRARVSPGL